MAKTNKKLKSASQPEVKPDSERKVKKVKSIRKKKSIHANTFEERELNRKRKMDEAKKKLDLKERRAISKEITAGILSGVNAWAKDNPLHPSTIAPPTQEGLIPKGPPPRRRTYKAFLRNLPKHIKPDDVDEFFYSKGVNVSCVRLLVHRRLPICLGWGFLEFEEHLEYEKALNLNIARFRGNRILVEGNLRSFTPCKKKPQKLLTYKPPARKVAVKKRMGIEPMETENTNNIEMIDIDN